MRFWPGHPPADRRLRGPRPGNLDEMSTPEDKPPTGFPEPPGRDPGDLSNLHDPHHALNNPVGEPDPTEWPDPYEQREDPRDPTDPDGVPFGDQPHPSPGSMSTSEPHPSQDPEAGFR